MLLAWGRLLPVPSRSRSQQLPRLLCRFPLQRAGSTLTTISHAKDLTVAARARQLKRDEKIKDTWVRDGEIYVKINDGSIDKLSTSRRSDVLLMFSCVCFFNINIPVVAKRI